MDGRILERGRKKARYTRAAEERRCAAALLVFACHGRRPAWAVNTQVLFDVSSSRVFPRLAGLANRRKVDDGAMESEGKTAAAAAREGGMGVCVLVRR